MNIKRRRHARIVLCPKSNPLIVYERRETSCSVVRMHQVLAGHVPTCQVSSQEKKKKKRKNIVILTRPVHSKTRYLIDYTRDRKSRWRSPVGWKQKLDRTKQL